MCWFRSLDLILAPHPGPTSGSLGGRRWRFGKAPQVILLCSRSREPLSPGGLSQSLWILLLILVVLLFFWFFSSCSAMKNQFLPMYSKHQLSVSFYSPSKTHLDMRWAFLIYFSLIFLLIFICFFFVLVLSDFLIFFSR